MTCREMLDFVMEYLDGGLPESQRARFEEHLEACPPCVDYLASYRETVELGSSAFEDLDAEVPPDVPERLVQAILEARRS